MSLQTFTLKQLRLTFTLSNNAVFAGTNSNVLQVSGLRASANIKGSGFPAFPECDLTVYGLAQSIPRLARIGHADVSQHDAD